MKKKILALMTVAALMTSSAAVFADDIVANNDGNALPTPEVQGDVMLINENPNATPEAVDPATMNDPAVPIEFLPMPEIQGDVMLINGELTNAYVSQTVTVTKIENGVIETVKDPAVKDDEMNNTVIYNTTAETVVIDTKNKSAANVADIKVGDQITGYTAGNKPNMLMLPATYDVDVIVINNGDGSTFVDVDDYVRDGVEFINSQNTLKVAIDDNTKIADIKNKSILVPADLDGKALAVFYGASTKSIPAQTTATDILLIGDSPLANIDEEAVYEETPLEENTTVVIDKINKTIEVGNFVYEANVYEKDGTVMVPLRMVAEALGFSVEWNGDIQAITLNGGLYSMNVGENAYVAGKMMPETLACAPEIQSDDLTYVPAEFFKDILQFNVVYTGEVYVD